MDLFNRLFSKMLCLAIVFITGHLTGAIDMAGNDNPIGIFIFTFVTTFTYDLYSLLKSRN